MSNNSQSRLPLVARLQQEVTRWREEKYKDTSEKTKRLLEFWFEEDHDLEDGTEFKFWNAQREAIETLIYCHEVLKVSNLYELNRSLGEPLPGIPSGYLWPKYALKMATGSGKTMVMALAIVWAYFNNYTKNFLVIAPNLIVLDRLGTDFVDGKIFNKYPIIPTEWKGDFQMDFIDADDSPRIKKNSVLFLTNIQKLYEREDNDLDNPVQKILGKKPPDEIKISLEKRREVLGKLENLMVINDEAHHVHDEDLEWNKTIDWLNSQNDLLVQLDFSATPRDQKGKLYPHIITDYHLSQAINDRIVKRAKIAELEDIPEIESDDPVAKYQTNVNAGIDQWKEIYKDMVDKGKKPVLFIMAENTTHADRIAEYIRTFPDFQGDKQVLIIHTDKKGEITKKELEGARVAAKEIDEDSNPYRAVVSVLMLREGWDVKNVVVIVPLRPYTAKAGILPEQTIGRGLRKMWPQDPEANEQLIIIEHPAFRDVIEQANREQNLGLTFTSLDDAYEPSETIKVDENKLGHDLEVPILSGGLTHSVKPLGRLNASRLPTKQISFKNLKGLDPKIRKIDLLTKELEEEKLLEFPYADQPEMYLASITRAILKKSRVTTAQFEKIIPIVRDYIESYLFDRKVNIKDEETLKKINNPYVLTVIIKIFVDAINALTAVEEEVKWAKDVLRASELKPFSWSLTGRRQALDVKKTVLNLIPVANDFEAKIAIFLDRAQDVLAFIKNETRTLKFKILYIDSEGFMRHYIPDFIVKTKDVNWVVETKGQEDVDVQYKDKRAKEWCKFAEKLTGQKWDYKRIDQEGFEGRVWHRFSDLT